MDKDNKRAQRRKDEQTIWLRRLNREFNNSKLFFNSNTKHCKENIEEAKIPEDLKNSKYGMLLKNTANPQTYKNVGKHLDNKHEQKIERREGKKIVNEALINYNNKEQEICNTFDNLSKLYNELRICNDEIFTIEQMLHDLPERLEGLKIMKKEIEEKICWLKAGNINI